MRARATKLSVFLLSFCVWLPTECFVRMHSTHGRGRFFSAAVRAVSTLNTGRSVLLPQVAFAAAKSPSHESYSRRHARMFGTSLPIMETDEETSANAKKHTDYEKCVRRLYMTNMFHPVKMGLTNMNQLHEIMGKPMDDVGIQRKLFVMDSMQWPFPD
jgi:hypothetical protein